MGKKDGKTILYELPVEPEGPALAPRPEHFVTVGWVEALEAEAKTDEVDGNCVWCEKGREKLFVRITKDTMTMHSDMAEDSPAKHTVSGQSFTSQLACMWLIVQIADLSSHCQNWIRR